MAEQTAPGSPASYRVDWSAQKGLTLVRTDNPACLWLDQMDEAANQASDGQGFTVAAIISSPRLDILPSDRAAINERPHDRECSDTLDPRFAPSQKRLLET